MRQLQSRTPAALLGLALALAAALPGPARAAPPLRTGTSTYTMAAPGGAATKMTPLVMALPIPDPANPAKPKVVEVTVDDIAAFNPATETAVQASARKAAALQAAVQAAITAGTLPNTVTVSTAQAMVPVVTPVFNPMLGRFVPVIKMVPGLSSLTIGGLTNTWRLNKDPTKQAGNGFNFKPGGVGPPPPPPPRYTPSMSGPGSGMGMSSGVDPMGNPSAVGFGFFDSTVSNPILFTAAIIPDAGETDAMVLSDLASTFNSEFAADGFTVTYTAATDTLALDQTLPFTDTLWFANTDTGLSFSVDMTPVPEPPGLWLLAVGLALLAWARRRHAW